MSNLLGKTIRNPVMGDVTTFLHTSEETNGEKTVLDIQLAPGGGSSPHHHGTYEESFEVLEGELLVELDGEVMRLAVGESTTVPAGAKHRFFAGDEPVRCIITMTPGQDGFEKAMAIAYGLACEGKVNSKSIPKSFAHIAILFTMADTNVPGVLGFLGWFLRWKAGTASSKRIEQELLEQYCS